MIKKIYKKVYLQIMNIIEEIKFRNEDLLTNIYIEDYYSNMIFINKQANLLDDKKIINDANRLLDGYIKILEYPEFKITNMIEWNKDYFTGFIWKNKYYKRIKLIDLNNNADVKVPWEISRFHYANNLGMAYNLTKNDIYTEMFINLTTKWIKNNKYCYSVNWTCAMEVAIRACNLIVAYDFFKESKVITKEYNNLFNKSLYMHGKFIIENLENTSEHRNNHYISDLIGLIWIGVYFKNKDFGKRWIKYALDNLLCELEIQVNNDGTSYEASTSYHALVYEMLLYTLIMLDKNKIIYNEKIKNIAQKMSRFLYYIIKPNGMIPLIGDDDSGKLLIFSGNNRSKSYYNDLLNLSGVYFKDKSYIDKIIKDSSITNWLLETIENENELNSKSIKKSIAFEDGGFYIYQNENLYLIIRCGEIGTGGKGSHAHNDQLSFELNIKGIDVFVDSGNYTYTGSYKLRNLFRSTAFHNTIKIENFEQNLFKQKHLFMLENNTKSELIEFGDTKFIGKHYGFLKKCNIIHQRKFDINLNKIIIEDNLIRNGEIIEELNIYRHLILSPQVGIEVNNSLIIIKSKINNTKIATIYLDKDTILQIDDIEIALGYGQKVQTKRLNFINKNIHKMKLEINILHK